MQVGDLVELSAAGSKAKQNEMCWGLWGMIMKIDKISQNHPYKIQWFRKDGSTHRCPMGRYEIKKLRGKK
tara:strand:+ start:481 stop:690 length:210 start_codon:yes stop_codon:yes gene_type:complete